MTISLRDYAPNDWDAICQIHDVARVQELTAGNVDPRAFKPMTEAAEGDEFFISQTVVAYYDNRVIGFISWNGAYITWLYVEPADQGRGVGRALLEHALRCIGAEAWTNMLGGNERALRLYRTAGFDVVWTRDRTCEGYLCQALRLALPGSHMRDPQARRIGG
ncbi:GNAT family N-acetyltransferase [Anatilimnocola floriformis]|uniref:GNAT family N-acetyltransferase n=1 Tax=Anatilimnocola floriformis TaxID=2948575 RepID=UPI0020C4ACEC|nr:GNAT family N-acetyltransferase [Anatilimnocola floriformis]